MEEVFRSVKRTEKQMLLRWDLLVKEILESTETNNYETEEEQRIRIAHLEARPEEWFNYYFPAFTYAPSAAFHRLATERVLQNREWYEVRMWSRELAKSTRTMMEVLYLALVGHPVIANPGEPTGERFKKRYILMISNSLDNAVRLLMPYKANLEYNRRLIKDYGEQQNHGSWQESEFITQKGVAFRALGAGQSPRGTRNEEIRPDVIIFDDIDTDADCLNPELVAKKWRWIEEAAVGTRSVSEPTSIIFCGTRIAIGSCIEYATRLADHVDEINIRDRSGRSVWPEKNSELDIDRVLSQKSYAAQQKEYFNNPLTEGSVFKKMAYKPARHITEYQILVCYTDPSYKDTNDYKAVVLVGKWQGEFHIIKCFLDKVTTAQMIDWFYRIMDIVGNCKCYYLIEEVFMQDAIKKEISAAGRNGRTIPIIGDTRKKPDKYTRIETVLEPLHRNGLFYLNKYEQDNPHMQRLEEQFIAFAPGSRAHDDGPDAVEGAVWMIMMKEGKGKIDGIIVTSQPANSKRF